MLDLSHIPTQYGDAEVFYFEGAGGTTAATITLNTWTKPRGKTMIDILLVGHGGNGGAGVIGANSTASGGAGGGSGGQTRVTMPLYLLPDILYIALTPGGIGTSVASDVRISPVSAAANRIAVANGGGNGGNASGATAGTAGTAGAIATAANMPLGANFGTFLVGQAGIAGGGAGVAGANLAIPTTGLLVTGGTGGGGLGAAAAASFAGGNITASGSFLGVPGGAISAADTSPPNSGSAGYLHLPLRYGGTGGASTRGSASGGGLVQASGGAGSPGCGGGGSGGAKTGSTAGVAGRGGAAFCIITVW